MRKTFLGVISSLLLGVTLLALSCSPASSGASSARPKTTNLFFGSTSSSSGVYAWSVAMANAANQYAPGVAITVVESGATYDNIRKIREGVFDGGLADGANGGFEMRRGIESFAGNAWEPIRWLWLRDLSVVRLFAREDSGIKTWSDLKGKKIWGGISGGSSAEIVIRANDLLVTGAQIVPGTLDDALEGLQTGRIQAVFKSSPLNTFDASVMQVHVRTPLVAIGFSDDEAAKMSAKYPQFFMTKTPAGIIKQNPNHFAMWETYVIAGGHTSSRLPEEVGYKLIKAVREHWAEIGQAYPSSASYDTIATYVKTVPPGLEVPLHAGVVRYAKEIGINIPPAFIPPEYK